MKEIVSRRVAIPAKGFALGGFMREKHFDGIVLMERLEKSMTTAFRSIDLSSPTTHKQVVDTLVQFLQSRRSKTKQEHVLEVLNSFFARFAFNLKSWIFNKKLSQSQIRHFLSHILSEIYYNENFLPSIDHSHPQEFLESFFLVLLAEILEKNEIDELLSKLLIREKLHLICHCRCHLREGGWTILNQLQAMPHQDSKWNLLITGLRRNYYETSYFYELLQHPSVSLEKLVDELEVHSAMQINQIARDLPRLIDLVIHSPVSGYIEIEKMKEKIDPNLLITSVDQQNRRKLAHAQEEMEKLFIKHCDQSYTFEEMREFFQLFGLKGPSLDVSVTPDPNASLSVVLQTMKELFEKPEFLSGDHRNTLITFLLSLCQKLYAFHREPLQYSSGLARIVYAVPTRGTNFSSLPWLPSVLSGLGEIIQHLHAKGHRDYALSDYPIIVLDQSNPKQFAENQIYVEHLAAQYKAQIWHVSRKQALSFSQKLGISSWIKIASKGGFGYAGSRNCVFFLAPVINSAARQGIRSFDALLKLSKKKLRSWFEEAVLGQTSQAAIIHMGEDDVAIPPCNFFADAFFAETCKDIYFSRLSFCIGRTKQVIYAPLSSSIVSRIPSAAFYSSQWSERPIIGGMKGQLTKPRFCLPIHLGNEEWHSRPPVCVFELFQQPVIHFGGNGFPETSLPLSPFDGLVNALRTLVPYSLQISMSSCLLDPGNDYGRRVMPWVEKDKVDSFHSLGELMKDALSKDSLDELKRRFWNNVYDLFGEVLLNNLPFRDDMLALAQVDFLFSVPASLLHYYETARQDAILFFEYGKKVVELHKQGVSHPHEEAKRDIEERFKIKISDTQFTKDMYLLIKEILLFCEKRVI